ncbi:hypothetical protein WCLP8_5230002 [uncultured Gammaproteobacteria bacterium]
MAVMRSPSKRSARTCPWAKYASPRLNERSLARRRNGWSSVRIGVGMGRIAIGGKAPAQNGYRRPFRQAVYQEGMSATTGFRAERSSQRRAMTDLADKVNGLILTADARRAALDCAAAWKSLPQMRWSIFGCRSPLQVAHFSMPPHTCVDWRFGAFSPLYDAFNELAPAALGRRRRAGPRPPLLVAAPGGPKTASSAQAQAWVRSM